MKEQATQAQQKGHIEQLAVSTAGEVFDYLKDVFDAIAKRAHEIFKSNGETHGHDLEHWFKAESELLHAVHIDLTEGEDKLTARAEVPGFNADQIKVAVERRRLTITGKRESKSEHKTGQTVYKDRCSNQFLRTVELPMDVDPKKVTTTLKHSILELEMHRAATTKKVPIASAAA